MTRRRILCEGPDDLNALRAIAQHVYKAKTTPAPGKQGAGADRAAYLQIGDDVSIDIVVPSKGRGGPGDGKSALPRMIAELLRDLPPQIGAGDESTVGLAAVVFDPDGQPIPTFYGEVERAIRAHASGWAFAPQSPGTWSALRESGERVEVRAVHWRALGGVVDNLPDVQNLERLLSSILGAAYPTGAPDIERWLTEIGEVRRAAGRKAPTWKAAIHLWLALVYEKADDINAASRVLHQQDECKPHIEAVLQQTGLLADLLPLLGPVQT
ncbi:MAG: hypothetical protein U0359_22935 [Byssovorax sp.]